MSSTHILSNMPVMSMPHYRHDGHENGHPYAIHEYWTLSNMPVMSMPHYQHDDHENGPPPICYK